MWANSDRNHNFLALRLISFSWRNQELKELESFELLSQHFLFPRSLFCLGNDGSALSELLPGEIPGVQLGKAQGGEGLQLLQEQPRGILGLSGSQLLTDPTPALFQCPASQEKLEENLQPVRRREDPELPGPGVCPPPLQTHPSVLHGRDRRCPRLQKRLHCGLLHLCK